MLKSDLRELIKHEIKDHFKEDLIWNKICMQILKRNFGSNLVFTFMV